MIKLIEEKDIQNVINILTNYDELYIKSLVGNLSEYMYVSYKEGILNGLMICFNDGENIYVKEIYGDNTEVLKSLLKHLEFNANKDTIITTTETNLIYLLEQFNYKIVTDNTYKKEFMKYTPTNIEIYEYYEQDEEFKRLLLDQINEPLWPGAKHLYERIINNTQGGRVFIMYDIDKEHIITFGTLHDFDEIESETLKPWIGSIYTFRPYRGNRFSEQLIKHIIGIVKEEGLEFVYLSSDNLGMYEKFGFELYGMMKTVRGNETQVFVYDTKKIENSNVKNI